MKAVKKYNKGGKNGKQKTVKFADHGITKFQPTKREREIIKAEESKDVSELRKLSAKYKRGGKVGEPTLSSSSGIDFRTKEEIKADEKAKKKQLKRDKRDERETGRIAKRFNRRGKRKGESGIELYKDKLQKKAKRKRKRKARRRKVADLGKKVVAGVRARSTVRRNRRKLEDSRTGGGSGNCGPGGCGAYD